MTSLLTLLIATTTFVSVEAAPAKVNSVVTYVTDIKYGSKSANAAAKNIIFRKVVEATSKNGPSMLKLGKLEIKNIRGNLAAIYTVTASSCEEVSRGAEEVMKNFTPVTYIKYKCKGEHELFRHGNFLQQSY